MCKLQVLHVLEAGESCMPLLQIDELGLWGCRPDVPGYITSTILPVPRARFPVALAEHGDQH